MKILFWIRPRTAFIMILAVSVLAPTMHAQNLENEVVQKQENSIIHRSVHDVYPKWKVY